MIDFLRSWFLRLVLCSMFLALSALLLPDGTVKKVFSFAGGLLLLLCMVQPLTGNLRPAFTEWAALEEQMREEEEALSRKTEEAMKRRIEEETETYICNQAGVLGAEVEAEVCVQRRHDGILLPFSAELYGVYSESLSAYLTQQLGIPPERQVWHAGKS